MPILLFAGCAKPLNDHTVVLANHEIEGKYEIHNSNKVASVTDSQLGIHTYKENSEVQITVTAPSLKHIVEEALNENIFAISKHWYEASAEERVGGINAALQARVDEIQALEISREEKTKKLEEDSLYIKYSSPSIKWERISKTKYVGTITLTKDIVFEVFDSVFAQDVWTIYTLGDAKNFNFFAQYTDKSLSSEKRELLKTTSVIYLDVKNKDFSLIFEEGSTHTEEHKLTNIYFIFLPESVSGMTKDDILNSDPRYLFKSELSAQTDSETGKIYYTPQDKFNFPENNTQLSPNPFTDDYRYIAVYVDYEVVEES